MVPVVRPRPWTTDEYHRIAEAGVLGEDDRVELIEGEIVEMSPVGWRHVAAVNAVTRLLSRHAGDGLVVSVQNPVCLSERSEPQPDVALLSWGDPRQVRRLPSASDAPLLVEVADTSAAYGRTVKLPLYARAGVPEAWLVDLETDVVEVHTEAADSGYAAVATYRAGDVVTSVTVPGLTVRAGEILVV
jgi:Uma2 family endonuclease